MLVVLDTNIIISGILSPSGNPGRVLDLMINKLIMPCFDSRILTEYEEVLLRPKFHQSKADVRVLMNFIRDVGVSVVPKPLEVTFTDEDDKMFYEVAKHCDAMLITGNLKHFPNDEQIITATEFLNNRYL